MMKKLKRYRATVTYRNLSFVSLDTGHSIRLGVFGYAVYKAFKAVKDTYTSAKIWYDFREIRKLSKR